MHISPNFHDRTRHPATRVSFQFSAVGTRKAGVLYVTMPVDGDPMVHAEKAARMAMKRAGADEVTLHAIVAPRN